MDLFLFKRFKTKNINKLSSLLPTSFIKFNKIKNKKLFKSVLNYRYSTIYSTNNTFQEFGNTPVASLTILDFNNENLIASGNDKGYINIYKLTKINNRMNFISIIKYKAHKHRISALISLLWNNENFLVSGTVDSEIKLFGLFDLTNNIFQPKFTLPNNNDYIKTICSITYKDELLIATGNVNFSITIWSLSDCKQPKFILEGHTHYIRSLTVIQVNKFKNEYLLASGSYDANIKVWKLGRKEPLINIAGHEYVINALITISRRNNNNSNECLLVSGSGDRTIKVWNLNNVDISNTTNSINITKHTYKFNVTSPVNSLCYMYFNNEKVIISGSKDSLIRIWSLSITHSPKYVLYGQTSSIYSLVSYSFGKERLLLSGSNSIRVY